MGIADSITEYVKKVGIVKLTLLLVAIGLQIYFVNITSPIPNYDIDTNSIYRGTDDYVVLKSVTWLHALISSAFILALWWVSNTQEEALQIINHEEAKRIAKAELNSLKTTDPRFKNYDIGKQDFTLKRESIGDKMVPNRYVIVTEMNPSRTSGEVSFYYRLEINPYTGRIERGFETSEQLKLPLLCPHGEASDFKIIPPSEMAEFLDVKRALSGERH